MSRLQTLFQVTRARTLPVMIAPVIIGAILAWHRGTTFYWGLFALTLLGALAAHLAANVTNDVFDFQEGTDQVAQELKAQGTTFVTGSQPMMSGSVSPRAYRLTALALFGIALLCGLLLTLYRPWAIAFGIAGFLLAFFYVAPPLKLAYRGRGLGELDIFLSFGLLPLLGAYYVQSGTITTTALLASIPIGLYTTAVLYFHHFLHWRADKMVSKITPIVALGERRARMVGIVLLFVIAITLILDALLGVFPWYSIMAIVTIVPVLRVLHYATGDLEAYLLLMKTNTNADVQTAIILICALLLHQFVGW